MTGETGESGLPSFSLPFPAGGGAPRHLQNNKITTNRQCCSVLDMFKDLCSLFLLVCFFSSADG
jgi:hypothetical protein